jgi:RNA recognition motif-containing protein
MYVLFETGVNLRKDRRTNQPRGFAFVTFMEESSARRAVAGMQGHSFQGRPLTVSTADARGTAAAAANLDNNDEDDADDVEWKTAPPARKNKANVLGNDTTTKQSKSGSKGGKKDKYKDKKKVARSWDEWAAPTVKTSQRQVPQSVPLVSPEAPKQI